MIARCVGAQNTGDPCGTWYADGSTGEKPEHVQCALGESEVRVWSQFTEPPVFHTGLAP